GGHPLDHAGEDLHALGDRRRRDRRPGDRQGRLADALLRLGQPRRERVRRAVPLPRRPDAEQAAGVRLRGPRVPGPAPGADGNAHPLRRAAAAPEGGGAERRAAHVAGGVRERAEDAAHRVRGGLSVSAPLTPERIAAYVASRLEGASGVEIDQLSRISGGASRETYRMRLTYRDGAGRDV